MVKKVKDKEIKELGYGAQVTIMSLGTILGIISVIAAVVYFYFRDFISILFR